MAAIAADVGIRISGDTSDLKKDLKSASFSVKKFAGTTKNALGVVGKFTAAAGAAGGAVLLISKNASDAAAEIKNLSDLSNTSTGQFQRMAIAARSVNIEQDKLADILKDVNDRVGDFMSTGGGPMADFFENIGPKIGVTIGQFQELSGPQALQLYYDSLRKANLSQAEMVFYMEAMASDATSLIPLLKDSGEGFKKIGDEAEKYGRIMSEMEITALLESKKAFSDIGASVASLQNNLASKLNPEISKFRDITVGIVDNLNGLIDKIDASVRASQEQAKAEEKIDAIIGKRANRRGRNAKYLSEEAAELNKLLKRQAGIEANLAGGSATRGRMAKASKERQEKKNELLQIEYEENAKRIAQLREESAAAQKVFEIKAKLAKDLEAIKTGEKPEDEEDAEDKEPDTSSLDAAASMNDQKLEQQKWYEKRFDELVNKGVARREKLEKLSYDQRLQEGLRFAQSSIGEAAKTNKKLFEIQKGAAIADAAVTGIQGAIKTWNTYPYPYNIPMTALHVAGTIGQIQNLKSQSFSGGGGGAAATPSAGAAPSQQQPAAGGGDSGGDSAGTLFVDNVDPDALFSGSVVRSLAEKLGEHQKNGGEVIFT